MVVYVLIQVELKVSLFITQQGRKLLIIALPIIMKIMVAVGLRRAVR